MYAALARPAEVGALLRIGPEPLSLFWSNPSRGLHAAGLGVAGQGVGPVEWLEPPAATPPGPFFGGWAFDPERPWVGFPAERWVLPEVLAWWDGRRPWLAAFGRAGVTADALRARLDRVREVEPRVLGQVSRRLPGDRPGWDRLVTDALREIDGGAVSKLVCARQLTVRGESPFVERSILKALEARHPQCWTFLLRGDDGRAFVGSSPETLCDVADGVAVIDALAGTAPKGKGETLLRDEKERREHAAVVRGIEDALTTLALELSVPAEPSIKRLANVDHLHTELSARLRPETEPLAVARALHPTPAVAGTPTVSAVRWLREHEGFARGWYCGAVGMRGPGRTTLAVALRSALVWGTEATVFVGAGVVRGSTPEREWVETERKAEALLPALGVFGASPAERGELPVRPQPGSAR